MGHSCAGEYLLVPDSRPNGFPVWKQSDGKHWLYAGKSGRWCIGGQDVLENDFNSSAGWIYQTRGHGGQMPNRSRSVWARWNGRLYEEDSAITVREHDTKDDSTLSTISRSSSSALNLVLECVRAAEVDIASLDRGQRCLMATVQAGIPLTVGPRHQQHVFHRWVRRARAEKTADHLFELLWKPPELHVQPSGAVRLMVDGSSIRGTSSPLRHNAEISVFSLGDGVRFVFRVVTDPTSVRGLELLTSSSESNGHCNSPSLAEEAVLDLRGRSPRRGDSPLHALFGMKQEHLRIVV